MRIIYQKYFELIKNAQNKENITDLQKYFERSDSDYGIIIDRNIIIDDDEFLKHYYNLCILNYNVLLTIKNILLNNLDLFLPIDLASLGSDLNHS